MKKNKEIGAECKQRRKMEDSGGAEKWGRED